MEKKPKTKEVVRSIKEHTASAAKDKVTAVGVKTKDVVKEKVEQQFSPQQDRKQEQSAESYASDQVAEAAERTGEDAVVVGNRAVKTTVKKMKEKRAEKRNAESSSDEAADSPRSEKQLDSESELPEKAESNTTTSTADNDHQADTPNPPRTKQDSAKADTTGMEPPGEKSGKAKNAKKANSDSLKTKRYETSPRTDNTDQTTLQKTTREKPYDAASQELSDGEITSSDGQRHRTRDKTVPTSKKRQDGSTFSKKEIREKAPELPAIKQHTHSGAKTPFETEPVEREISLRTKQKTLPKIRGQKTIRDVSQKTERIRGLGASVHKAKEVEHGAVQTIKTADKTVKNAERTAKATKKAAEASAKAAKRSEEAARQTAKAAAHAAMVAIKAVIEGIKAAVAAAKELIAAAAAGSPAAIIIIIVICLIAAVGGTCFGIFLSNDETTGTQITMTDTISQLSAEHYSEITNLKSQYTYDSMQMTGSPSINWKDVLAVYAVKTTTSTENGNEVATMDNAKMDLLRQVISDMNQISCSVEQRQTTETVTEKDEYGNDVTTTQTVTKNILKVTITQLMPDQIAEQYNFNDEQNKQLSELLSPEYDELWDAIIGSGGVVLTGNSTYIPTDIFAWPLMENGSLSSPFGYRTDPISGEVSLHGGTDISMPTGSPILAAADGVVVAAQWHNSYGNYVKIQHDGVFSTLYAHCSAIHVTVGQQVRQGEVIADVGATGRVTGAHLHFEVRINDQRVDAMQYFQ